MLRIAQNVLKTIFTFHDVSINTDPEVRYSQGENPTFTFHDVSINTVLILEPTKNQFFFTFHDVSINTTNPEHF